MINLISIFTRGGAILWSKEVSPPNGKPINKLIKDVLLEDRSGQQTMEHGSYTLRWTFANQLELVFVAVYLNLSRLLYVEELLTRVKEEFVRLFGSQIVAGQALLRRPQFSFEVQFEEILCDLEKKYSKKKANPTKPRRFYDTEKGKEHQREQDKNGKKKGKNQKNKVETPKEASKGVPSEDSGSAEEDASTAATAAGAADDFGLRPEERAKFFLRAKKRGPGGFRRKPKNKGKTSAAAAAAKGPEANGKSSGKAGVKPPRRWPGGVEITEEEESALDYAAKGKPSTAVNGSQQLNDAEKERQDAQRDKFTGHGASANRPAPDFESSDEEEDDEYEDDEEMPVEEKTPADTAPSSSFFSTAWSKLANSVNFNKPLTEEQLEEVISQVRDDLIVKNVATAICDKVCSSVKSSLIGKKPGSFTRVKTIVKKTLEETLLRIITPKKEVDFLHGVATAREKGRPYSVVFLGVNGVGKSTTLAKVANYLRTRNVTVSIAACDTFRSGAVEQLQTHARYLGVRLFQKGYAKDPSAVAMDAITEAKRYGDDVVLIDTAGRMQDNEPLMRALSKLVVQNKPDLILFVGEALVGNDAVDQLTKFNRGLTEQSVERVPRLIDGIVLTKFDTVDEKVGAAISMTYTTGAPIVFIGTGQTYQDLKRIHAKTIIRMLLKD